MRFVDALLRISSPAALVLACSLLAATANAQTRVEVGYRDFSFGTALNTPTGEKPERKLWWNDNSWWGVLFNASAAQFRIYRFDSGTQSWTDTGTVVDTRTNSRADILWDQQSGRLYIVSHVFTTSGSATSTSSQWGKLSRFSYDATLRRYTLETGFPVDVTRGRSETLTVAKDASQRLWVTFVEGGKVKVNWSLNSDLEWGVPVNLPLDTTAISVNSDDISAIVALANGDIGVAWSNQTTRKMYFALHRSTDAPGVWGPVETVAPGPGCSGACADDHLSLSADQAGRVLLAFKTSLSGDAPLIMLAVRDAGWSLHTVVTGDEQYTRPVLVLDEEARTIYVFASHPESGGAIHVKTSSLDAIAFAPGLGEPFIFSSTDTRTNNATSTRQNVTASTGVLVLASDQDSDFYLHNYLPLGGGTPTPPQPPTDLTATAGVGPAVSLTWTDASSNETAFRVERAVGTGAFAEIAAVGTNVTSYQDLAVQPATTYRYRVRASNADGFSNYSPTAEATTPPVVTTPPAAPTNLGATAVTSTRIDLAWTDASATETAFHVERDAGGGSFAEIATVGTNVTAYSDLAVTASTTYSYRVRASNGGGVSTYSNTAQATTPAGADPGAITTMTFEGGALTGSSGADSIAGTVVTETTAPLKGTVSARIPGAGSSYLNEQFAPAADLYVSFYLRLPALPSGDVRVLLLSNGGTSVGNLLLRSTGRLRLRIGSTTIGTESAPLAAGQLYRIGVHQKAGSGTAVLEAFVASGDAAFTAPFAATTIGAWSTSADRLRLGSTTSAAVDAVFDDVVLATAAMPGPSTGGGTETPPATPTTLSATAVASGRIDLAWTDASSDETAFHVERSPSGGGVFAEIAVLGANVTAYADTAVAAETGYSYRVRAANAAGFSAYSPTAEATTPPVVTAPPEAPTTLSATAATSTRIDLTWTDASATETAFHVERAPAGGSFDEVATLGANVAAYSDPGVTADTTYSYRVRASNGAGFSAYSTTVDVTTPAGADPATLKTMSFEDGSLTDPISGADAVRGTVLLETTVPISGQASARVPAAARSYLEEHFTPEGDLYVSFDLRLETLPSSDVRLALLSSDGTSVGNLLLRSSGRLSLRLASTTVGAESPPLVAGQLYRIGVRQKAGGGSAVLEGFLAGYDDPFGAPFASTASGTWTAADRLRLGSTTGAVDATFDNLTLNTGGLADPSVD